MLLKSAPAQKLSPAPHSPGGQPWEEGHPLVICTDINAEPTARDHVLLDVTEVSYVVSGSVLFTAGESRGALETKGILRLREGLGALQGRAAHSHWLRKCHL